MEPHSRTLAWKIPWMEEPGRLQSMGSLSRTRQSDFTFAFHFHHWRRKWQPTPVFLPGNSQGRESLVGCRPWGRTESNTTEATQQQQQQQIYQKKFVISAFLGIFRRGLENLFVQFVLVVNILQNMRPWSMALFPNSYNFGLPQVYCYTLNFLNSCDHIIHSLCS